MFHVMVALSPGYELALRYSLWLKTEGRGLKKNIDLNQTSRVLVCSQLLYGPR